MLADKIAGSAVRVRLHRPLLITAAGLAVLCLVSAGGLIFDDRELLGAPIWLKAFKFTISIAIYLVTLAWLISLLPKGRKVAWWAGTGVALGLGLDMALLVYQMIVRGRRLHFNLVEETDQTIHNLLATGAYGSMLAAVVLALLLTFQRLPDKGQAAAVRAGLGIALVGMAVATFMFTPNAEQEAMLEAGQDPGIVGAHAVGVPDGGPGLPLLGWSTEAGDLRVPHFVGLHALQALPLLLLGLGLLARRFPVLGSPLVRRDLIRVAGGGYLSLVLLLTWQALRGQSLIHPDATTLVAFVGVLALVGAGTAFVLRRAAVRPPVTAEPERVPVVGG
ncbi:hypothetical protein [Amycolatopsis nigrescens]|uniref:hypothetical protein n=1 Tax=Amycolatopsis nigrescens TaxID=381445 RepID=UPI0006879542|nr:hypothetical protein [Amycolatopsis nigrescens]